MMGGIWRAAWGNNGYNEGGSSRRYSHKLTLTLTGSRSIGQTTGPHKER